MMAATTGLTLAPMQVYAEPAISLTNLAPNESRLAPKMEPLSQNELHDRLRAYHARLDLMHALLDPNDDDASWQVKQVIKHLVKDTGDGEVKHYFKVEWIGGDKQILTMDSMRLHDPFLLVRYGRKHNLFKNPGWEWFQSYLDSDTEFGQMVCAYRVATDKKKLNFGVEIPSSVKHAMELDKQDNNSLWKDAWATEVQQLLDSDTFRVLEPHEPVPKGYKRIPYHCIFDVKFDLRRKARLVAGGHRTDPPKEDIYSGVAGMETVRLGFVLADLNDLMVCAADIGNAFLNSRTREKVYIIAGPEFGPELEGKRLLVDGAWYGLKSSAARFHEHLSVALKKLGFRPSRADFDFWFRVHNGHYEYVARYVDDLIVFAKDPMSIMKELEKVYLLKGVGIPQYYLGGDVLNLAEDWEKEDIKMAFSAETYIKNVLEKQALACDMTEFRKESTPHAEDYHPELDSTELLGPEDITLYKSLIGSLNWVITLGRFDVCYATMILSRYSMAPRKGHLKAVKRVFGYLRVSPKGKILIDNGQAPIRDTALVTRGQDWNEFYPDAVENIPDNRLEPCGGLCRLTVYVDADHARDQTTRRSITGIIVLLNNTPLIWVSKGQKTVETSMYGSELVAGRIATELIIATCYKLMMLGLNLEKT